MKRLSQIAELVLLINFIWFGYLVWTHLNVYQNDFMGHISSAQAFRSGLFHQFNDASFLGYIHGLFYPPLEDAFMSLISFLTANDFLLAFQIYLTLLLFGFCFVLIRFARSFESSFIRSGFLVGAFLLLNMDKHGSIDFQGLSSADIFKTGLETQVLGAIGFFEFLRAWLQAGSFKRKVFWLSWVLLSHIILFLSLYAFGGIVFLINLMKLKKSSTNSVSRLKEILQIYLTSFCLCGFFIIPFLAHSDFLVHGAVYRPLGWIPYLFVFISVILSDKKALPFTGLALLFFTPLKIFSYLNTPIPYFPLFHYYRFAIVAVWLALIGWLIIGEGLFSTLDTDLQIMLKLRKQAWVGISILGIGVILSQFHFEKFYLNFPDMTSQAWTAEQFKSMPAGRTWTIANNRGIDFSLDGRLKIDIPDFLSVKGLYWESHRSHVVLTSYLTTLLNHSAVLDYFYYNFESCAIDRCFLEHFARDYNISSLIIDSGFLQNYLSLPRKACMKEILQSGTGHYQLKESSTIHVGLDNYRLYSLTLVQHELPDAFSNQQITKISNNDVVPFSYKTPYFYRDYMKQIYSACRAGKISNQVFVSGEGFSQGDLPKSSSSDVSQFEIKKIRSGVYEINASSRDDQMFRLKLSYFPGVHLRDFNGHDLKLYEALPGMVGVGHGKMFLTYEKTGWMYFGYLLSIITSLGLLIRQRLQRRR